MAYVQWINTACLFVLLLAAALDTRGLLRLSSRKLFRIWSGLITFVAIVLAGITVGLAVLFLATPLRIAGPRGLDMVGLGLNQLCLAFVFLLGTLALDSNPLGRPLPLLDRMHVRRRFAEGRRERMPVFRTRAVSRFTAYLSLMLAHSYVWLFFAFAIIEVRPGDVLKEIENHTDPASLRAVVITRVIAILLAPFYEEAIYRGYIQARITGILLRLAGPTPWSRAFAFGFGIAATALLWAVMHSGVLEPEWIKWGQILGVGLVLGIARLRLGLEACIALHLLFNIIGGFLVPSTFPDGI